MVQKPWYVKKDLKFWYVKKFDRSTSIKSDGVVLFCLSPRRAHLRGQLLLEATQISSLQPRSSSSPAASPTGRPSLISTERRRLPPLAGGTELRPADSAPQDPGSHAADPCLQRCR
jgi:hypothetical protein